MHEFTKSQELIWLGERLYPGSPMNNMAFAFWLGKELDVPRFQAAFRNLLKACDAMRVIFTGSSDAWQSTLSRQRFSLEMIETDAMEWMAAAVKKPLNVAERVFEAALLHDEAGYYLYLNQHHLVTDGWGMANQLKWLLAAYRGTSPPKLPPFEQYVYYASAEKELERTEEQREAWRQRVADYPTPPALFGRTNATRNTASTRITRRLSSGQTARLRALAGQPDFRAWTTDLALFNLYLTALYAYVYRISGQRDLVISTPAHNRVTAEQKATPGLFMELFPVRATVAADDTFRSLHEKVCVASLDFLRYARSGTSSVETGRSFNVLLNYLNVAFVEEPDPNFGVEWLHPGETEPGHHLKLQVYDFAVTGQPTLCFDLNDAVVPAAVRSLVVDGFLGLLDQMLANMDAPVVALTQREQTILASFQAVDPTYPTGKTVVDLFQEQAARNPTAPAVHFCDLTLSYVELDVRTDAFAGALQEHDVRVGDVVPVRLERSEKMLIALLGILKAGAAYLPIDPEFPPERQAFLGADAGARVMVVEGLELVSLTEKPSATRQQPELGDA
ncbi:MAG: condensation domain-containing protein, partial [Bacteroidota bacterium]